MSEASVPAAPAAPRPLVIVGAASVGLNTLETARALGREVLALIDDTGRVPAGTVRHGVTVEDRSDPWLERGDVDLAVAIGDNAAREDVVRRLLARVDEDRFPTLVDPRAFVSPYATLGPGTIVQPGVRVQPEALVRRFAWLGASAGVGHDTDLGDLVWIGGGAMVGGWSTIGARTFLGLNSVVLPRSRVGDDVVVGALSLVKGELASGTVAAGTPARVLRTRERGEPYLT